MEPELCNKCGEPIEIKRKGMCHRCYQLNRYHSLEGEQKKHYILTVKRWRANHRKHVMWCQAKNRARKRGTPFNIEVSDVQIPTHCPILGIPLYQGGSRENAPSLDCIIPELGYTKGNICVISGRANRIKSDASLEELEAIVKYRRSRPISGVAIGVIRGLMGEIDKKYLTNHPDSNNILVGGKSDGATEQQSTEEVGE